MSSAKAEVKSMIDGFPEDASHEDIQYHLYVLEKVRRGLECAETENVISHEDAKARLGTWLAASFDRGKPSKTSNPTPPFFIEHDFA